MTEWLGDFPFLRQQLAGLEIVAETKSTNDVLKSDPLADYSAVLTDHQTAGRGRIGRTWVSAPGHGLAFSILVPGTSPSQQSWLPLVAGASVVGAARALGGMNAELKWPNDVLVEERKLAGILCEVRPDGRVIVGIGVNVDYSTGGLPSEEATSLAEFGEVSPQSIDALLATVVSSLREFVETPAHGALTLAKGSVEDVLATIGREVSVHDLDGTVWSGVAHGLTDEGHLVVQERVTGDERIVVASDVRHLRQ